MLFIKSEVENEQRILLAAEGFGVCTDFNVGNESSKRRKPKLQESSIPTAAGLINCNIVNCIFCGGTHASESCFKAQKFTYEQKKHMLTKNKACFRCLKPGHLSKSCRGRLKCLICGRSHAALMCPELPMHKLESKSQPKKQEGEVNKEADKALANHTSPHVFLQTVRVTLNGIRGSRVIRALFDTGSQRSYILKSTAQQMGYTPIRKERIVHCLFGGSETEQGHNCYEVKLNVGNYSCSFEVLDQHLICNDIRPVFSGPWMEELMGLNIQLSDTHDTAPIELLIGADVAGKLYTGERRSLRCGLVAIETFLGWTLMGKIPCVESSSITTTFLSLFVQDASVTDLWGLEVLGITDPAEKRSRAERELAAKEYFQRTIEREAEGRYEVKLPWLEEHPSLPDNYYVAKKRLDNTLKKLKDAHLIESYDLVFQEWLAEGIIEEVPVTEFNDYSHYMPHRPVIKENSTTKIRPVFDASAREKDKPSLNQCLEKGPNLIELIPAILLRFRNHRYGVVSDIRKAFLQISVHEADRNFLRFLWTDSDGNEKRYRHRRVVFGVSSSPFLLGATIEYHLKECLKKSDMENVEYSSETIQRLSKSFYVDNCVTSVPDEHTLKRFIRESSLAMAEAKFDLRGWEFTRQTGDSKKVPVLGLIWNADKDILAINPEFLHAVTDIEDKLVTKRMILSAAQRVFDPIGFTCPATLSPKLLLQRIWRKKLGWDEQVDAEIERDFLNWLRELPFLSNIEIPRWGGFWERLIGILKSLLRKVLGRACLNYEDLSTLICDCEAIVNARPLTYLSNDASDLMPLTPAMYLRDLAESGLPECDEVEKSSLCKKMIHKQKLRTDLRRRFRSEYLGYLKLAQKGGPYRQLRLGEIVLIGNDSDKRIDWPLGRVIELIPGKDKQVRLVRIKTSRGQLLRPIQRIYPLECIPDFDENVEALLPEKEGGQGDSEDVVQDIGDCSVVANVETDIKSRVPENKVNVTRSGRVSRLPSRLKY